MTTPLNPRKYVGTNQYLTIYVTRSRRPTGADVKQPETGANYPISAIWQVGANPSNGVEGELWILSKIAANVSYWVNIYNGTTQPLQSLSDTANTVVYPSTIADIPPSNIQLINTDGSLTITSDPVNHRIILNSAGGSQAIDSIQVDAFTAPGTSPVLPTILGLITVTGGQVAAGTTVNVIQTNSLSASTYTIQIQRSSAQAVSTIGANGACHFNSADFIVDANGFVSSTSPFSSLVYTLVTTAMSPYAATLTDFYLATDSTAGPITIQLPNAPSTNRLFVIKDRAGTASTNNVTVTTVGGVVLIDGTTSHLMAGNYDAINLLFNGTFYEVY